MNNTTVKIYHNPRCRKSRETLALLQERGIEADIIEYLKTPPSTTELNDILSKLNMTPQDLMRTKESVYKELDLKNSDLTDDALIKIMAQNPILIERPIVISTKGAALGRPPENALSVIE